jgi:hypothetical protein
LVKTRRKENRDANLFSLDLQFWQLVLLAFVGSLRCRITVKGQGALEALEVVRTAKLSRGVRPPADREASRIIDVGGLYLIFR